MPDRDGSSGRVLKGRFRLEERIGVGASAVVYRASDLAMSRQVAVKQVKPELSGDERFIKLFRSEARLAGQLDHPNVLTIFDWEADEDGADGGAYLVTEYLTGGTLRQLLNREGVLPVTDAAMIGLQVARGLRAAHEAGMVHRDIKPGNILFGADGRVRIGDFGIARAVAMAAWTEPEGHLIGTARYAAPEQGEAAGEVTGRSDVYSLAVCLIEMVTGEVPLIGESALATMVARQENDLPVDESVGALQDLLSWAGHAEWAVRPTAGQVADELAEICGVQGPDALTVIDATTIRPIGDGMAPTAAPPAAPVVGSLAGALAADASSSEAFTVDPHSPVSAPNPVSALDPHTATDYLDPATGAPASSPIGMGWGRGRIIGLGLFLLAVIGAVAGGWALASYEGGPTERIAVSLPTWPVPDFGDLSPGEARSAVAAYGWTVTVTERHADATKVGELLEQQPPAGEIRGPGIGVDLVLSLGPEPRQVPELVGLPEAEARQALTAARLTVGVVTPRPDEEIEKGTVLEATVAGTGAVPGSEFPTGTSIDLVVSGGPAPRTVPDLGGLTEAQARQALAAVDLSAELRSDYSDTIPAGQVIVFSPADGTELERGATVTVTVSQGRRPVVIPDLTGVPVLEAAAQLGELGFEVRIQGATDGDVLGTRPSIGTEAPWGSAVTVVSTSE